MRVRRAAVLVGAILCANACASDAGPDGPKRVFITSQAFAANMGGLAGGDARCNTAAQAAGLGGNFVAWLSDATTDARDRITGDGPWHLVDGTTVVFTSKANLTTTPLVSINRNENGTVVTNASAWTGTNTGGVKSVGTCTSWTSTGTGGGNDGAMIGSIAATGVWTQFQFNNCAATTRNYLYCFQV